MKFNEESFKKALSECKIIRWQNIFKQVVKSYLKEEEKQLIITDVGCSFSIGFAQYIAKKHYTLINQIGKIHYWRNEEFSKTTEQLLKDYKETLT